MTTLFYNWKAAITEVKGDPLKLVDLLIKYRDNRILKYGLKTKLKGNNFLLNPVGILNDKNVDVLYVYQYLLLSSYRDYTLYNLYGIKSLPLSYFPEVQLDSLKTNPLLTVTKTDIHFKYEE